MHFEKQLILFFDEKKAIDTILPNIPRKKKQTTTLLLAS